MEKGWGTVGWGCGISVLTIADRQHDLPGAVQVVGVGAREAGTQDCSTHAMQCSPTGSWKKTRPSALWVLAAFQGAWEAAAPTGRAKQEHMVMIAQS